ncbi:hypothetical protein HA402_001312 [Bradysia odoriphaga]|nr:hypothetical protein HA402_001312 [Bradysia odoriphaga]
MLVEKQAKKFNVNVITTVSHTIYNPDLIIQKSQGVAPKQYQGFLKIVSSMSIPEPVEAPAALPAKSKPPKDSNELKDPTCYDCPALHELRVNEAELGDVLYPGGETEGLKRFQTILRKTDWVCSFEKPKTSPNSLEPSTTVLSPYLKFGCISSRLMYTDLQKVLKNKKKHTAPPVSLIGQLLWREFFYTAAASEPNFNRMVGNSICRQIPWQKNEQHLEAWTYGRTGYPFIDAIMRQLRQEGWIHHLARHAVACFLTRGDLWISWEDGQRVFEELLLDADWALNAGNWMWLSASAFYHLYSRVYSPVAFGKKTDKDGEYIRKYVPELANYPKSMIYEPWTATAAQQREYGCIIGKDYPQRIVIHEVVLKKNMAKMADAYQKHRDGVGGGKFDVDNTQVKPEPVSPKTEPVSPSTSSGCSSSKIMKVEQNNTILKYFKNEPKSP